VSKGSNATPVPRLTWSSNLLPGLRI